MTKTAVTDGLLALAASAVLAPAVERTYSLSLGVQTGLRCVETRRRVSTKVDTARSVGA